MALTIDKSKTAFLTLHFQNDIVNENGKLALLGMAVHVKDTDCLTNTKRALDASRNSGILVVHVAAVMRKGYPEFSGISGILPQMFNVVRSVEGLVECTWGAVFHDLVKPQTGEFVVTGRCMNALSGTELQLLLAVRGIRCLVLSGVATNFVVENTARYAMDSGYEVVILRDCCASANEEMHSYTLDYVLPYVATISNSNEYVEVLN